jgi:hypothetical protein
MVRARKCSFITSVAGHFRTEARKKIYLNFRNNLYMLFKNLPRHQFTRIFFARMVLDGVAAVKFLAWVSVIANFGRW